MLTASELQACQLSQLNPITANSISFGPMAHSLLTSPKFSIIPTQAVLRPYPEDFFPWVLLVGGVWGGMSGVRSSPTASGQDSLLLLKFLAVKSVLELRQDEASPFEATIGGTQKPKLG